MMDATRCCCNQPKARPRRSSCAGAKSLPHHPIRESSFASARSWSTKAIMNRLSEMPSSSLRGGASGGADAEVLSCRRARATASIPMRHGATGAQLIATRMDHKYPVPKRASFNGELLCAQLLPLVQYWSMSVLRICRATWLRKFSRFRFCLPA